MSLYKGTTLISGAIPDMANQSLSNLNSAGQDKFDAKVNKTGDTMTGNLAIKKSYPTIVVKHTDLTFGTNPSSIYYGDSYMLADTNGKNMGSLSEIYQTDGAHFTRLWQKKSPSEESYAIFDVGFNASGNSFCNFPNTTRCDGQWVSSNVTIASGLAVPTSAKSYTLSSLPNDGNSYYVLLTAIAATIATSAKFVRVGVYSSLCSTVYLCSIRTRTSSMMDTAGSVIIPVSSNRTIWVNPETSSNSGGTIELYLRAYRRIGTNS